MGTGGAAFELVAEAAGEAEVFKDGLTAPGLGSNVVHRHRLAGVGFGGVAVGAVAIVGLKQPVALLCGDSSLATVLLHQANGSIPNI